MEGSKNATELGVKQILCKWPERKEVGIIELDREPGRGREKNTENVLILHNDPPYPIATPRRQGLCIINVGF